METLDVSCVGFEELERVSETLLRERTLFKAMTGMQDHQHY